jgi:3,4-dihydroxy-2-butanone 4-phosphate synthase
VYYNNTLSSRSVHMNSHIAVLPAKHSPNLLGSGVQLRAVMSTPWTVLFVPHLKHSYDAMLSSALTLCCQLQGRLDAPGGSPAIFWAQCRLRPACNLLRSSSLWHECAVAAQRIFAMHCAVLRGRVILRTAVRGCRSASASTDLLPTAARAAAAPARVPVQTQSPSSCIYGFSSVSTAIAAISNGEFVLVLDDEDRENEGDLIIAADKATPEKIAYMIEYTSGAPYPRFVLWHQAIDAFNCLWPYISRVCTLTHATHW